MLDGSSSVEYTKTVNYVLKRDGSTEKFDQEKIKTAVHKAMKSIGIRSKTLPIEVSSEVTEYLNKENSREVVVNVDEVHKTVENVIMDMGLHDLAREYIVYRFNNMPNIFRKISGTARRCNNNNWLV